MGAIRDRLLGAGLLTSSGDEIDVEFFATRLGVSANQILDELASLDAEGIVREELAIECASCHASNKPESVNCWDCEEPLNASRPVRRYYRKTAQPGRDPSAVFLIHGMNTLGPWQEDLAWRFQLLYGHLVPVFVFKYGWDIWSPITKRGQRRRLGQLAMAIRRVQADLRESGRTDVCDVVCHSFGTLLFSQLLLDQRYTALRFGNIVLAGSIVPRTYPWDDLIADGRVEAVLNHRAGKDRWVKLAPWAFPNVGTSGVDGFNSANVMDLLSSEWGHSDFFSTDNFGALIRAEWSRFLSQEQTLRSPLGQVMALDSSIARGYWAGRLAAVVVLALAIVGVLFILALIGPIASALLHKLF